MGGRRTGRATQGTRRISEGDERMTQALSDALREVFGEKIKTQRFIDVSRIPLICQNINNMHENINEIKSIIKEDSRLFITKDEFWPVKTIVYSLTGSILLAVIGAIVALVIKT